MFVMVGALAVFAPANHLIRRRASPVFAPVFAPLSKVKIDAPLVGGSVLFGIGWGLSGYCPGPALTNVGTGATEVLLFVAAMIAGFLLHGLFTRPTEPRGELSGSRTASGAGR
jgi:uncharacterized membrane protein YedE/YeeE